MCNIFVAFKEFIVVLIESFNMMFSMSTSWYTQNMFAHRISISDILPWDRKSYLTNAILPRLSCESCTGFVLELMHMVVK